MKHKREVGGERHEGACPEFPRVSLRWVVKHGGTQRFPIPEVTERRKNWNKSLGVTEVEHATITRPVHSETQR